jgi:hypothetical protein
MLVKYESPILSQLPSQLALRTFYPTQEHHPAEHIEREAVDCFQGICRAGLNCPQRFNLMPLQGGKFSLTFFRRSLRVCLALAFIRLTSLFVSEASPLGKRRGARSWCFDNLPTRALCQ